MIQHLVWYPEYVCPSCGQRTITPASCHCCGEVLRRTGYEVWGFWRNNGTVKMKRRRTRIF